MSYLVHILSNINFQELKRYDDFAMMCGNFMNVILPFLKCKNALVIKLNDKQYFLIHRICYEYACKQYIIGDKIYLCLPPFIIS